MTMKAAALVALAASANAFAPNPVVTQKTALRSDFCNGYVGNEGTEPMPWRWGPDKSSKDFDPCGFTEVRIAEEILTLAADAET